MVLGQVKPPKTNNNSFRETRAKKGLGFLKFMSKTKNLSPDTVIDNKEVKTAIESNPTIALDLIHSVRDQIASESTQPTHVETAKEFQSAKKAEPLIRTEIVPNKVVDNKPSTVNEKATNNLPVVPTNVEQSTEAELPLFDAKADTDSDPLKSINSHVLKVLYEQDNTRWSHFWNVIEDATKWKRETITYGIFSAISGFLILMNFGEFVASGVGVIYPLISTYQVLYPQSRDSAPSNELRDHWFRYWSIYALINIFDIFLSKICGFLPTYQFCKVFFLLGTAYPEWSLSKTVYESFVQPIVKWIWKFSNKYIIGKDVCIETYLNSKHR